MTRAAAHDAPDTTAMRIEMRAFLAWCLVSAVALLALVAGLAVEGRAFFYAFQGPADASLVEVKFLVWCIAWSWLGVALFAAAWTPGLLRQHAVFAFVWFLLALGFLNVVRGPHAVLVLDFSNYFTAAVAMRQGLPLTDDWQQLYLYPPLLATLLRPLVPLGIGPAAWLFRFGNYGAVLLFAWLLYLALQRVGAGRPLAALLVLASCIVNVPIADTLYAQQVNLHLANLVLGSFLLFPRYPICSALLLALGAHLKVYPALLVLPFLYLRQWRWLGFYALFVVGIFLFTSAVNSPAYYWQFVQKAAGLRELGIRNASVDSFVHNTLHMAGLDLGRGERGLSLVLQLGLALLAFWAALGAMREGLLLRSGGRDERVVGSAFAGLSIVMLLGSPSIWVHHNVLVLFPALVILLAIRERSDLILCALAYFCVFLIPVNEIYPFAYLRLAGLVTFVLLLRRIVRSPVDTAPLLSELDTRLRTALS